MSNTFCSSEWFFSFAFCDFHFCNSKSTVISFLQCSFHAECLWWSTCNNTQIRFAHFSFSYLLIEPLERIVCFCRNNNTWRIFIKPKAKWWVKRWWSCFLRSLHQVWLHNIMEWHVGCMIFSRMCNDACWFVSYDPIVIFIDHHVFYFLQIITFDFLFFWSTEVFYWLFSLSFMPRKRISRVQSIIFFRFFSIDTTGSFSDPCIDITQSDIMLVTTSFSQKPIKSLARFIVSNSYWFLCHTPNKSE